MTALLGDITTEIGITGNHIQATANHTVFNLNVILKIAY